jgi:phosphoglycolate phosphatase-like HAD superfamily hydrolase
MRRLQDEARDVADYVRVVTSEREAFAALLRELGAEPLPSAGNFVFVRGGDPAWLVDALAGLGIAVRGIAGGVRVTMPGDAAHFAALTNSARAALAPQAILLDLDGVLADIEGRRPLAELADVQALAGLRPLGVVTGCPRRLAESVLARHGFAPFVKALVTSEDGPGKPDPAPVTLALQRLGVSAAWMVGDNPGDIVAARGAGAVPLAIAPSGIGAESHAPS